MTYKYAEKCDTDHGFERAVLANANRGGENVATGAMIGALLGASAGFSNLPQKLVHELSQHDQLAQEIEAFVASVPLAKEK